MSFGPDARKLRDKKTHSKQKARIANPDKIKVYIWRHGATIIYRECQHEIRQISGYDWNHRHGV